MASAVVPSTSGLHAGHDGGMLRTDVVVSVDQTGRLVQYPATASSRSSAYDPFVGNSVWSMTVNDAS